VHHHPSHLVITKQPPSAAHENLPNRLPTTQLATKLRCDRFHIIHGITQIIPRLRQHLVLDSTTRSQLSISNSPIHVVSTMEASQASPGEMVLGFIVRTMPKRFGEVPTRPSRTHRRKVRIISRIKAEPHSLQVDTRIPDAVVHGCTGKPDRLCAYRSVRLADALAARSTRPRLRRLARSISRRCIRLAWTHWPQSLDSRRYARVKPSIVRFVVTFPIITTPQQIRVICHVIEIAALRNSTSIYGSTKCSAK
jgi:hypothetical protein